MFPRLALCCALVVTLLGARAPVPEPTPSPDVEGERIFAKVREVWRTRADVPYVRYGALERYQHGSHVVDNWFDVYYRTSDGAMKLEQMHDIPAENARLKGFAFSIFGANLFDTNGDAAPIRVDEPRIEPDASFGLKTRFAVGLTLASPVPAVTGSALPSPQPSDALREITRVESNTRAYQIDVVGPETVLGETAVHLHMTPLHDPTVNRLRDLWVDPVTYRTIQLRVQGLLSGKPYDGVAWTVRYVLLEGRSYVQQISADAPLKFGLDESIPKFEFDFVDYQFPNTVPKFTFESWTPFRLQN
jgi:hypothetical protein